MIVFQFYCREKLPLRRLEPIYMGTAAFVGNPVLLVSPFSHDMPVEQSGSCRSTFRYHSRILPRRNGDIRSSKSNPSVLPVLHLALLSSVSSPLAISNRNLLFINSGRSLRASY